MITDEQRTGVSRDTALTLYHEAEITTMPFLSPKVSPAFQRMFDLGAQKLPRLPAPRNSAAALRIDISGKSILNLLPYIATQG